MKPSTVASGSSAPSLVVSAPFSSRATAGNASDDGRTGSPDLGSLSGAAATRRPGELNASTSETAGTSALSTSIPATPIARVNSSERFRGRTVDLDEGSTDEETALPTLATAPSVSTTNPEFARSQPVPSTQLDLFGSPVCTQEAQAFDVSKPNFIMGDDNLRESFFHDSTVINPRNGRLSHLKKRLYDLRGSFPGVKKFLLFLSLLDKNNLPSTNFATCKSLIYHAHKIFPSAEFYVILYGIPSAVDDRVRDNLRNFNILFKERKPSFCNVIEPPSDVCTVNGSHVWEDPILADFIDVVKSFLC